MNITGKQFDLVALIEQRRRAILTVLGAQHLSVGENGEGGMNLLEGKSDMQAFYAERDNTIIEEMFNKNIFPQLMRINEWKVSKEDMPEWVAGEIQPVSIEEFSKGIQRVQNFLPQTVDVINQIMRGCHLDVELSEDMDIEAVRKLLPTYENNTGQSGGSSGTGDTQAGGANSSLNSDNAA